ncbi:MAG: hypothetical protein A2370_03075 [Candidatus Vogelbacteria bacterium RIFOXYB1_FULL_42_16]|uniref:Methyltransferase type 11 domain-containing protein n=1 Tax=Candidatus Vogelbacteria bacterium RIFOXYB1_FULL_42_16 TaxID=1802436 RepID=A0A1G2QGK8_9BACT|nr:MAG: hypothetical protein A2370_03075 [Candidatus Vogelbacteria bacterium RIFOXYB1_FULL_42_16]
MEIQNWPINQELKKEADNHYRTNLSLAIKDQEPWEIISRLTFDGVAPKLTLIEIKGLFDWVNKKVLKNKLSGIGLELGAGAGFMSAILADRPEVQKVYAVEAVENIVKELGPKITNYVLKDKSDKVIGCIGDFDNLQLSDNSIDFVFDFYSLHHSPDLGKTLRGTSRVLKRGGFVLCFDKTRDNKLTIDDLDKLLDQEYSRESKILMGLNPDIKHTRRQNGEQEYRLSDWEKAFKKNGFDWIEHYHLARVTGNFILRLIKKFISCLPLFIQIKITKILYKNKKVNNLEISNLVFCPPVQNFPKEISLIIAYKN